MISAVLQQVGHRLDDVRLDLGCRPFAPADLPHVLRDTGDRAADHVALLRVGPVRVPEPGHDRVLGDSPGVLGVHEQSVHVEQHSGEPGSVSGH